MTSREDAFLRELQATFRVEAVEHLQTIAQGLVELEKEASPASRAKRIQSVFRAAHSLKGAARAVNQTQVESSCQVLEDLFAAWKREDQQIPAGDLDQAHRTLDIASGLIGVTPGARREPASSDGVIADAQVATAAPESAPTTVRVAVDKLDARLLEAEEMLSAKLAAAEHAVEMRALASQFDPWRKEWGRVQPQTRALRQQPGLAGVAEFLEWNHDYLRALEGKVAAIRQTADRDRIAVARLVDELLADSKQLLMLPVSTVSGLFSKLVRDLAREQGKEVELVLQGTETEVDKRILDEMKDPLIHLLRNAVDHGVELPAVRLQAGKPARAVVRLEVVTENGSQVLIRLSDDGAGVDVERLKASAVRRGLLRGEQAQTLDEERALELMFEPELSASAIVTTISGRGLGLAIVREKVEKLGGHFSVQSVAGRGTTFSIWLSPTLATLRGILVSVAQRTFVLPTTEVERVIRFRAADVHTVEGRETVTLGGRTLSLVRMADVLQLAHTDTGAAQVSMTAVVLGIGESRTAFSVDSVLDEQELLVKALARPLERVRHIGAATILGSGQVAPILRVADLLKSARKVGEPARASEAAAVVEQRRSVLVAEDSITSRLLLKGILESAGYSVKTVVDGLEAYTALRTGTYDLVVSDVEMPRLNGFDLTARIRADQRLGQLPVVLVTALENREDRERGIEVGANAYLVKSSLDQSNLLEAVRRLI